MINTKPLSIISLASLALIAGFGCGAKAGDEELKTTAAIANDSPAAQQAGAAPLINPDVPPPGVRKGTK